MVPIDIGLPTPHSVLQYVFEHWCLSYCSGLPLLAFYFRSRQLFSSSPFGPTPSWRVAAELLGELIQNCGSALLAWRTILAVVDVLYQAKLPAQDQMLSFCAPQSVLIKKPIALESTPTLITSLYYQTANFHYFNCLVYIRLGAQRVASLHGVRRRASLQCGACKRPRRLTVSQRQICKSDKFDEGFVFCLLAEP